jgi:hypothetical protein
VDEVKEIVTRANTVKGIRVDLENENAVSLSNSNIFFGVWQQGKLK